MTPMRGGPHPREHALFSTKRYACSGSSSASGRPPQNLFKDGDPPMNQLCACRSVSGILLLTALCVLFSAPVTHAEEDVRRATPPPGKLLLFVVRIAPKPIAAQVPVLVNTVRVAELANGTF